MLTNRTRGSKNIIPYIIRRFLDCDTYLEEGKELYSQDYYDRMEKLAQGRIVVLTENSIIPDELRRLYCKPRFISLKQ